MVTKKRLVLPLSLFWVLLMTAAAVRADSLPDFTKLVDQYKSAVVNVSATEEINGGNSNTNLSPDQIQQLPEFFRRFFQQMPNGQPQAPEERRSLGSGFIVSSDGYILTNNHVVKGADKITVRLSDRRELKAKVVGVDKQTDIAVLKVDAHNLPVVKLGDSNHIKVGQWVFAIGSPFGFDYSVTQGIVSAIGRALPNENYVPFIQTDVPINPGNSGGPLFNMDGQVIGINSQIYTRSGGYMGLSFAIPINVAMNDFHQIKTTGHVQRGWLGVLIQEVSRGLAESFGLSKPHGALIAQVVPHSPAAEAGLKAGDIILSYNGHEIGLSSELPPLVGSTKVGDTATLQIMRNGKEKTIDVKIGKLPANEQAHAGGGSSSPGHVSNNRLGVDVQALPKELKDKWSLSGGVLVTRVGEGPALDAGIRPHDVISSINNKPINSVAEFNKVVKSLPEGKAIPMLVVRKGNPSFIVIKLSKKK